MARYHYPLVMTQAIQRARKGEITKLALLVDTYKNTVEKLQRTYSNSTRAWSTRMIWYYSWLYEECKRLLNHYKAQRNLHYGKATTSRSKGNSKSGKRSKPSTLLVKSRSKLQSSSFKSA